MSPEYVRWLQYHRFTIVGKRKEVNRLRYDAPWVDYPKVAQAMQECLQLVATTKESCVGEDAELKVGLILTEIEHQPLLKRVEFLAALPAGEVGQREVDVVADDFHSFLDSALTDIGYAMTRDQYSNFCARALSNTRG